MIQELRQKQARGSSPKKHKSRQSEQEAQFLEALAATEIELMDLDPQLKQILKDPAEAQKDFLSINLFSDDAQHFNPDNQSLEPINFSK